MPVFEPAAIPSPPSSLRPDVEEASRENWRSRRRRCDGDDGLSRDVASSRGGRRRPWLFMRTSSRDYCDDVRDDDDENDPEGGRRRGRGRGASQSDGTRDVHFHATTSEVEWSPVCSSLSVDGGGGGKEQSNHRRGDDYARDGGADCPLSPDVLRGGVLAAVHGTDRPGVCPTCSGGLAYLYLGKWDGRNNHRRRRVCEIPMCDGGVTDGNRNNRRKRKVVGLGADNPLIRRRTVPLTSMLLRFATAPGTVIHNDK